ncbi:MAG TPA: hypothetical protein VM076_18115 [Gemmatimonadaceae bacterium]|nr:hypothetical protein [Gemmatimonadaceae bacterium]
MTVKCDDYLAMLATSPVEELAYGHARDHAAGCHHCDRVTRIVAEREHYMRMALDNVPFSMPAAQTAATALTMSRRRKVGIAYRIGIGVVTTAIVLYMVASRVLEPALALTRKERLRVVTVTESFHLQCLSPTQASELLRPYLGSTGRVYFRDPSLGVIDVAATIKGMATARTILARYDTPSRAQCDVQVTVPPSPPSVSPPRS